MSKRRVIIGIYKITSPSGKVYIGQSDNILRRFNTYKKLSCKDQPRLYNSFRKYGADKHKFEIIHECNVDELTNLERYYQDLYNCISNKVGLNCVLQQTDTRRRILTPELRDKLSKGNKGKKVSNETRLKMSEAKKGLFGLKHSTSVRIIAKNIITKEIIIDSVCNIAKKLGVNKELIFNRCNYIQTSYRKLFEWDIDYMDKKVIKKLNLGQNIPILDLETGVFYYGREDFFNITGISRYNLIKYDKRYKFLK